MNNILPHLRSFQESLFELEDYLPPFLKRNEFPKNHFILKNTQICTELHFIVKGLVFIYIPGENKEWVKHILTKDDVAISVHSFFNQKPSPECIQCLEPCVTLSINFSQVQKVCEIVPAYKELLELFKEEYLQANQKWEILLNDLPGIERYQHLQNLNPEFFNLRHNDIIAKYLRMHRETFYAIRKKLSKKR